MTSLADTVLPLIRTRADLHRWSAANAHGNDMHEAIDVLEAARATTDPAEFYTVVHAALASAVKVIARADDSSGIIGDACRRLLDLHPHAAAAQSVDQRPIASHFRVRERSGHLGDEPVDGNGVAAVLDEVAVELVDDAGGPQRSIQATLRQAEQGVTEVCGVEHTRVEHDCEGHGSSAGALGRRSPFVHVGLIGDLDHAIERSTAFTRGAFAIGQHVGKAHPAMTPRLFERDLPCLEELHQRGPADAEQVGSLLRRQSLMYGRDGHRLATCHRLNDVPQDFEDLRRQHEMFTVRS